MYLSPGKQAPGPPCVHVGCLFVFLGGFGVFFFRMETAKIFFAVQQALFRVEVWGGLRADR